MILFLKIFLTYWSTCSAWTLKLFSVSYGLTKSLLVKPPECEIRDFSGIYAIGKILHGKFLEAAWWVWKLAFLPKEEARRRKKRERQLCSYYKAFFSLNTLCGTWLLLFLRAIKNPPSNKNSIKLLFKDGLVSARGATLFHNWPAVIQVSYALYREPSFSWVTNVSLHVAEY